MKKIIIADNTLCQENNSFGFKEKIEIVRQLENIKTDIIELPEITNNRADILFVRTVSSFVKKSIISIGAGTTKESIENAITSLSGTKNPRIRIELPVSVVGMEYVCHKKPQKMLEWIKEAVSMAKEKCDDVEFCATDATRTEKDFLESAVKSAIECGATQITICDNASNMLPDDFSKFISEIVKISSVPVGVSCENKNGLGIAEAILSVKEGASCVKTSVCGNNVPLETFCGMVKNCGENYGFSTNIRYTELNRTLNQIRWILESTKNDKSAVSVSSFETSGINLTSEDTIETLGNAIVTLGYDLSEEDTKKVYEEFLRVAQNKNITAKELDAIIASVALQVPATYKLVNYVINNGNIISASAQITLEKDGKTMQGACIGNGPVDAAFLTLENIIGRHYELDDFQIQSVTQGKEAMGSAIVKLRSNGKTYSGNGISTDIIGASIKAYIGAINKIVYEEA